TLAIALHMLQGTPYIYQGEEIGMINPHFKSIEEYRDIESLNAFHYLKSQGYSEQHILEILDQKSRDNSRTPMQWDDSENAGFTSGESWIATADNYQKINVEQAMKDSESVLHTYKALINLRHQNDILTYGNIEPMY
ncbi:alpha,alpha-phosphotrehalase, partial [Mesorhizobium sp. M7A.F.Ca.CA.001.10.2.1]